MIVIEVSVAVIAGFFVLIAISLIVTLFYARKTLTQVNRLLNEIHKSVTNLTHSSLDLVDKVTGLMAVVKEKTDSLAAMFHQSSRHQGYSSHDGGARSNYDKMADLMQSLASGVMLFNRIKEGVKDYVKSR